MSGGRHSPRQDKPDGTLPLEFYGHEINEKEQEVDDFLKTLDFCDSATPSPQSVEEQLPYRNVSDFFTFFDKCRAEGKPSFTWLSFAEPHNPYQVPYPYFDKFPPHSLPEIETSRDDLEGKDQSYEFMDWAWDRVYKEDRKERILRDRSNYYGMLSLIDDQIRRLVEGIRARGALDDTLIIILSDHGEFIGEYGLIRKGCNVAQLLAHIPMVILGHGVSQRGIDGKDFVSIIDIFPTICETCLESTYPSASKARVFYQYFPVIDIRKRISQSLIVNQVSAGSSGIGKKTH